MNSFELSNCIFYLTLCTIVILLLVLGYAMGREITKGEMQIPNGYALVDVGGNIDWLLYSAPAGAEIKLGAGTYTTAGINCSDKDGVKFNITGAKHIKGAGKDKTYIWNRETH